MGGKSADSVGVGAFFYQTPIKILLTPIIYPITPINTANNLLEASMSHQKNEQQAGGAWHPFFQ
jgi:hypothetical protein